ncbi:hypothetical protein [Sporosarcina globispora]|uniref:hypothetical protein n=1 Tax=Sporosarcina globispora TaxID=1459 RepID=UPI000AEA9DC9|nr:hypothetical protein [Sporosarcina globispora]
MKILLDIDPRNEETSVTIHCKEIKVRYDRLGYSDKPVGMKGSLDDLFVQYLEKEKIG